MSNIETNELLVKQYQDGNNEALEKLINNNKGLVYTVVRKYYTDNTNSIDIDDLAQEGYIGLMRAAKLYNFDIQNKASFSTYAFHWINSKINRFISTKNTNEECSLDEPIEEDSETTRNDMLVGEDGTLFIESIEQQELKEEVSNMLNTALTLKEREVIKCRFGFNGNEYTLEETGKVLGINGGSRVREIEVRGLRKLRRSPFAIKYRKEFIIDRAFKTKEVLNKNNVDVSAIYFEELKRKLEELYIRKCS